MSKKLINFVCLLSFLFALTFCIILISTTNPYCLKHFNASFKFKNISLFVTLNLSIFNLVLAIIFSIIYKNNKIKERKESEDKLKKAFERIYGKIKG